MPPCGACIVHASKSIHGADSHPTIVSAPMDVKKLITRPHPAATHMDLQAIFDTWCRQELVQTGVGADGSRYRRASVKQRNTTPPLSLQKLTDKLTSF